MSKYDLQLNTTDLTIYQQQKIDFKIRGLLHFNHDSICTEKR